MQKLSYDDYKLEYRCYDIPIHISAFAFIGDVWMYKKNSLTAHFHNCMEIGYCHDGKGYGYIEDKKVTFGPGDICVIAPNTIHMFTAQDGTTSRWEWIMADTGAAMKGTRYEKLGSNPRLLADNPDVCNIFPGNEYPSLLEKVKMMLYLFHQTEVRANSIKGLLLSFLTDYLMYVEEVSDGVVGQSKHNKMKPALLYIQEHYGEKITVQMLADTCKLSEEQFRRVFKQVTHTSPLEYLNQYRIKTACKLLLSSDMPISEIAGQTGFATASTFNRQFAASKGMPPLKWRQMAAKKTEVSQVKSLEAGQQAGILPI